MQDKLKRKYVGLEEEEVIWIPIPKRLYDQFNEETGIRKKPRTRKNSTIGLKIGTEKIKGRREYFETFHFIELERGFDQKEEEPKTITKLFVDERQMLDAAKLKLIASFLQVVSKFMEAFKKL